MTIVIISILLILIFIDIYLKKDAKTNGIEIIVKHDSVQKLPKRTYYYFSYYLNREKISTSNISLENYFIYKKMNMIPNKFYYGKYSPKNPEVIFIKQDHIITDTT